MESITEVIQKGIRPLATITVFGKSISFSNIFFAMFLASFLFFLLVFFLSRSLKSGKPNRVSYFGEILYLMLRNFVKSKFPNNPEPYIPFIGTLFGYLLICNLLGIFSPLGRMGLHWVVSPAIDLSFTLGAAVTGIVFVHAKGIQKKGLKHYAAHYFHPYWFMFPVNVIEELVKPLSLSIRLFGNIFGEHVVYEITFYLISFAVPVIVIGLSLFTGLIQAYVFSLLILVYLVQMLGINEVEKGSHS
jgi:F-type H+-transporting ATPase subunit a